MTFGLADATAAGPLEARRPSGAVTTHPVPSLRTTLVIDEPPPA